MTELSNKELLAKDFVVAILHNPDAIVPESKTMKDYAKKIVMLYREIIKELGDDKPEDSEIEVNRYY